MAREFQNAMMPAEYPEVPIAGTASPLRLEFGHFYQPSETLGGDFFDLIKLDDSRVGRPDRRRDGARCPLGAGHRDRAGAGAEPRRSVEDPGAFLGEINRHLYQLISRSGQVLFVTAFLMVLDTRRARVDWAVAGHPAPLRAGRCGCPAAAVVAGAPGQPALGLMEEAGLPHAAGGVAPG